MRITIMLKNGQKHEFQNADVQKKNEGKLTAVFDSNTFRILAEFRADEVLMCQASSNGNAVQRAVIRY